MGHTIAATFLAFACVAAAFAGEGAALQRKPAPLGNDTLQNLLPKDSPPLGLDGFCPVTLRLNNFWRRGNPSFGAVHGGRTYLFASEENQRAFLKDPENYSPLFSGADPYFVVESKQLVEGQRKYGMVYENRVILFVSPESFNKFCRDPRHYFEEAKRRFSGVRAFEATPNALLQPIELQAIRSSNVVETLRVR